MKGQRSYIFEGYHPNDGLEGGQWVLGRHGVWRWEFNQIRTDLYAVPDLPRVEGVIACPTCHVTVTETCRTREGHRTRSHPAREIPRQCPCGKTLQPQRRLCEQCRIESKRAHARRRRARLRMEAS